MGKPMKPLWLNVVAWSVLFALGWWGGRKTGVAGMKAAPASHVRQDERERGSVMGTREDLRSTGSAHTVSASMRSFKQGARAWLLEQASGVASDSDPASSLRYSQRCLMLDEASALELAGEIAAIRSSDDPALKKVFKGLPLEDLLGTAVFRLSQLNPDAAVEFLNGHQLHSTKLVSFVFSNVAAENVQEAGRFLEKVPQPMLRDAVEPVAAKLATIDPGAAVRLLERYPQPELDSERRKLVERIAEKNPLQAMEVAGGLAASGRNPDVILAALRRWKVSDPEAARQWASQYQGPGSEGLLDSLDAEKGKR